MTKLSLFLFLALLGAASSHAQTQVWVIYVGTDQVSSTTNYNHETALNGMIDNLNAGSGGNVNYGNNIIAVDTIAQANAAIDSASNAGAHSVVAIEGNPATGQVYDHNGTHNQSEIDNRVDRIESCANGVIKENDIGDRLSSDYGGSYNHLTNKGRVRKHVHHFKKKKWWHP